MNCFRAGEMIPEVEGTRPWRPPRKRVPKCLKGPKTTYRNIAIAEKQSKGSKMGPFSLYIGSTPSPAQEMEFMGPRGEGPSWFPPVSPAMNCSSINFAFSALSAHCRDCRSAGSRYFVNIELFFNLNSNRHLADIDLSSRSTLKRR